LELGWRGVLLTDTHTARVNLWLLSHLRYLVVFNRERKKIENIGGIKLDLSTFRTTTEKKLEKYMDHEKNLELESVYYGTQSN